MAVTAIATTTAITVSTGASSSGLKTYPCGICRQVMSEFFKGNEQIILENAGEIIKYTIDYLLPDSFKL